MNQVLVTGATSGIGRAIAVTLHKAGFPVAATGRNQTALAELASEAPGIETLCLDLSDRPAVEAALQGRRVDILINNAGVMPVGPFLDHSDQAVRSAIEVNFYGVLNGCRLVLPEMTRRRSGHVVNIASVAGVLAVPGQALYAGTKFAVVGLSTALADEFAPQGVDVSVVMPTFTNTELIAGTDAPGDRKPLRPNEIAAAVVKILDKPTTAVSVPGPLRPISILSQLLPPRGRRWLSHKLGTDTVFMAVDTAARAAYERRAESATGLLEE